MTSTPQWPSAASSRRSFTRPNRGRQKRLAEELAGCDRCGWRCCPEYVEEDVPISRWCTLQTDRRTYSVPSRLIGETVRVRRYEERVEVYLAGMRQLVMPRLTGEKTHAINYRDIIEWLIRKPGAFAHYRFRADLFPSLAFGVPTTGCARTVHHGRRSGVPADPAPGGADDGVGGRTGAGGSWSSATSRPGGRRYRSSGRWPSQPPLRTSSR